MSGLAGLLGWSGLAAEGRTALAFSAAFLFGTLIGFERQWRQRTAGLRTNVLVAVGAAAFADLAAAVFRPKPPPTVGIDHLHTPQFSVAEQAALLAERLAALGSATFAALTAEAMRQRMHCDFGIHNTGGIRCGLAAGEALYGGLARAGLPRGTAARAA